MAVAAAIYYNIFMLDHENSNLKRKKELLRLKRGLQRKIG
jgi:hypothetical protein